MNSSGSLSEDSSSDDESVVMMEPVTHRGGVFACATDLMMSNNVTWSYLDAITLILAYLRAKCGGPRDVLAFLSKNGNREDFESHTGLCMSSLKSLHLENALRDGLSLKLLTTCGGGGGFSVTDAGVARVGDCLGVPVWRIIREADRQVLSARTGRVAIHTLVRLLRCGGGSGGGVLGVDGGLSLRRGFDNAADLRATMESIRVLESPQSHLWWWRRRRSKDPAADNCHRRGGTFYPGQSVAEGAHHLSSEQTEGGGSVAAAFSSSGGGGGASYRLHSSRRNGLSRSELLRAQTQLAAIENSNSVDVGGFRHRQQRTIGELITLSPSPPRAKRAKVFHRSFERQNIQIAEVVVEEEEEEEESGVNPVSPRRAESSGSSCSGTDSDSDLDTLGVPRKNKAVEIARRTRAKASLTAVQLEDLADMLPPDDAIPWQP